MKEYVEMSRLRSAPPRELHRCFKVGDDVDAYRDSSGCWVKGNVRNILEDSKDFVGFEGGDHGDHREMEVDSYNLRLLRKWDDRTWVAPFLEQDRSSEMELRPKKLKLRIKLSREKPPEEFEKGTMVEVTSNEDGFKGSWYSASIFNPLGNNKFIVEYLALKRDDDETLPLRELREAQYIRPSPPPLSPILQFKPRDEVDAWYNEGWWVGSVSKVLNGLKYIVFLSPTNEELEFAHSNLRLHQDWINGEWVMPSKQKSDSLITAYKPKKQKLKKEKNIAKPKAKFKSGMKVEVRSDEKGYEGSWYSATIIKYTGNDKYLVEYQTLKTDDETEFLKEEAKVSDIRPCPPPILRVYPFELFERVDAWFNDGWWSGQVYTVYSGMSYVVYFKTTHEKLQFGHADLRPHQEWKNGEWVAASKD